MLRNISSLGYLWSYKSERWKHTENKNRLSRDISLTTSCNGFCFHILLTFTFSLFKFSRVSCSIILHATSSSFIILCNILKKEGRVFRNIGNKKYIFPTVTESSLASFFRHFNVKLIRSFLGIRSVFFVTLVLPSKIDLWQKHHMPLIMSLAFTGLCLKKKKRLCAFPHLNSDLGGVDLVFLPWRSAKGSCVRISDIYIFSLCLLDQGSWKQVATGLSI